jgi:hypothetical protein
LRFRWCVIASFDQVSKSPGCHSDRPDRLAWPVHLF